MYVPFIISYLYHFSFRKQYIIMLYIVNHHRIGMVEIISYYNNKIRLIRFNIFYLLNTI